MVIINGNLKVNLKEKGRRLFITATSPPSFTLDNYKEVIFEGLGQAFLNTIAVALPATLIPLIICSFFCLFFNLDEFFW